MERKNMSLLDKIKSLICKLDGNKSKPEQKKEIPTPEVKPQPVVETKPEVKPEAQAAPKLQAKPEPKKKVVAPAVATTGEVAPLQIPEDSALRRHFLSALKAKVVATLPPCPTDSSLKRHYDTTVQAEIEKIVGKLS
jgi:outer membrane biosynthesis protein TonB